MNSDPSVPNLGEIFTKLGAHFAENVLLSLSSRGIELQRIEIKARGIALMGKLLGIGNPIAPHRSQLTQAFDEVFADLILSCYLSAAGLDKPACSVLRRAFETGIAITYLWDSPCAFWGWTAHDDDLNFRAMVEFLGGDSYKTLLQHETDGYNGETIIDAKCAEALYRVLSNVTHGKWATFETPLHDRFSHNAADWKTHLGHIEQVQDILLSVWKLRFKTVISDLLGRIPALEAL